MLSWLASMLKPHYSHHHHREFPNCSSFFFFFFLALNFLFLTPPTSRTANLSPAISFCARMNRYHHFSTINCAAPVTKILWHKLSASSWNCLGSGRGNEKQNDCRIRAGLGYYCLGLNSDKNMRLASHWDLCFVSVKLIKVGRTWTNARGWVDHVFFRASGVPALVSPSVVIRPASPHFHQQPVKSDAAATLKEGAPCEIYLAVPISWPLFFPPPGLKRHRRLCLCCRAAADQKLNLHKLTNWLMKRCHRSHLFAVSVRQCQHCPNICLFPFQMNECNTKCHV